MLSERGKQDKTNIYVSFTHKLYYSFCWDVYISNVSGQQQQQQQHDDMFRVHFTRSWLWKYNEQASGFKWMNL